MSKYDWSNVPEYIEVITTCKDGTVKGYCKPIQRGETWCSSYTINGMPPYQGNWQDSLEERPKRKNMKIEINAEQPLDEVVKELERLGYMEDRFQEQNPDFILAYRDGYYAAYHENKRLLSHTIMSLAELKEMKC